MVYAGENFACTKGRKALVFQVLINDNGALAHICPRINWDSPSYFDACREKGRLVYITPNNNYDDTQMIKLKRNECFVETGTYSYVNKNENIRTVRAITIKNKKY